MNEEAISKNQNRVEVVLLTGLSGAGKSSAAKSLEDIGFYCVDNLPLPLIATFLEKPAELLEGVDRIALVTDIRAPGMAAQLPGIVAGIDRSAVKLTILFLETDEDILVRRYSETRRRHPLAPESRAIDGIRQEREMLADVRGLADRVIDTSDWTIHEMRAALAGEFNQGAASELAITIVSFGFKHGPPIGTDMLFDVRFLKNPYFDLELRQLTGIDPPVREFLERESDFGLLTEKLQDLMSFLLPRFEAENRSYLTLGVGCTGGKHRSVAVSQQLADVLEADGWFVRLQHRDLLR